MTTKYIQPGEAMDHTPSSAVAKDEVVVFSDKIGVANDAIASGATGILHVAGVFELPCLSTDVVAQGDKLYWDAGNTRLTLTASTHKTAGWAFAASADGVTTCQVKLNAYAD